MGTIDPGMGETDPPTLALEAPLAGLPAMVPDPQQRLHGREGGRKRT